MNTTIQKLLEEAYNLGLIELGPDAQAYSFSNAQLEEFVLYVQKQTKLLRFLPLTNETP
jgi:hypothetical protein